MTPIDEKLERLINRALDGELTADERLALDRELIREPAAREVMEHSGRLDALAAAALRSALAHDPLHAGQTMPQTLRPPRPRGYHRAWWLLPGAVAAALLAGLLVFPRSVPDQAAVAHRDGSRPESVRRPTGPVIYPGERLPFSPSNGGIVPVGHRPTWVDRAVDRGVYGVRGSDGNIYLIEIQHTQTREQPGTSVWARPVGGDL